MLFCGWSARKKKITIENLVFADVFLSERLVSSEFAFGKTTLLVFFLQVKSTHICCNSIGKEKEKINNVFFLVCVCVLVTFQSDFLQRAS